MGDLSLPCNHLGSTFLFDFYEMAIKLASLTDGGKGHTCDMQRAVKLYLHFETLLMQHAGTFGLNHFFHQLTLQ